MLSRPFRLFTFIVSFCIYGVIPAQPAKPLAPAAKAGDPTDLYSKDLSKAPQTRRIIVTNTSVGYKPLTELGQGTYHGYKGGLYGDGENKLPAAHATLVGEAIAGIKPLDRTGHPQPDGKVVLLVIGMSNTSQEAKKFISLANSSDRISPHVVIVDGAQGAQGSIQWSTTNNRSMGVDPWEVLEKRLAQQNVTAPQVQAIWLKAALMGVGQYGPFPRHADVLSESIRTTVQIAHRRFPNLRIGYLSSRIYGGYSPGGNREPFAYESGFAVRDVILRQINGAPDLNCNSENGPRVAPVIVWGPYLWADGMMPRASDGLIWQPEDFREDDGMHPSESGQLKVARMLLQFFTQDPTAAWFRRS